MKCLSELRTCCGGATAKTVVDGLPPSPELIRSMNNRVVSRRPRGWKPTLHVISEDKTIADVDQKTVRNSGNKRVLKDSGKSGRAPKRFGDGYWKTSYAIAMPALSGMLF